MQLVALLADLPGVLALTGAPAGKILTITADSRQVAPGALFVAYRGASADGHRFIPDAVGRGAAAVVGELPPAADLPVPYVRVADGRAALAWLNAAWYGHPSRSLALVGITGTDGKTTTANLLYSILQAAGRRAGLISTVSAVIGERTIETGLHTTTPDAPDVQRYLAEMRAAGAEIAVLETTSHGLAQQRVTGCAFDVAVITNITHEHLDFHGTYEAYRDAKALLFQSLCQTFEVSETSKVLRIPKTAVLNRDDSSFEFLSAIPAERVITYGVGGRRGGGAEGQRSRGAKGLHLTAVNIQHSPAGIIFDIEILASPNALPPIPNPQSLIPNIQSPLVGMFNVSNILAAAGAALALGAPPPAIAAGVQALSGVPGRMERIDRGQPFTAIVDFAHTPNALERALATARALTGPGGRVLAVFGSAGLRDRTKRRLMGQVAAAAADLSVITAEDPRTEDLSAILAETAAAFLTGGQQEGRDFVRIPDRGRAILYAAQQARPGDVLMVCGKGHEQSMCFGVTECPWRDQEVLRWALDLLRGVVSPPPLVLPTWTSHSLIPNL